MCLAQNCKHINFCYFLQKIEIALQKELTSSVFSKIKNLFEWQETKYHYTHILTSSPSLFDLEKNLSVGKPLMLYLIIEQAY